MFNDLVNVRGQTVRQFPRPVVREEIQIAAYQIREEALAQVGPDALSGAVEYRRAGECPERPHREERRELQSDGLYLLLKEYVLREVLVGERKIAGGGGRRHRPPPDDGIHPAAIRPAAAAAGRGLGRGGGGGGDHSVDDLRARRRREYVDDLPDRVRELHRRGRRDREEPQRDQE